MALKRLTVHLEPTIDDWLRRKAQRSGKSINQELNEVMLILMKKLEDQRIRQETAAMKAKIEAIRNQKATPKGVAHLTQAPHSDQTRGQGETR